MLPRTVGLWSFAFNKQGAALQLGFVSGKLYPQGFCISLTKTIGKTVFQNIAGKQLIIRLVES